jgi:hypothetical protein
MTTGIDTWVAGVGGSGGMGGAAGAFEFSALAPEKNFLSIDMGLSVNK